MGTTLHIQSGCTLKGDLLLTKTIDGPLRVVNEGEAPLPSVLVNEGKHTVTLEGSVTSVAVNCAVPLVFRNSQVETLSVSAPNASLAIEKDSSVSDLTIGKEAKGGEVTVEGSITTLTAHAAAKVTSNSGKISSAHAAADGLVLAGTLPDKITMNPGIVRPKDGNGKGITSVITVGK